MCPNQRGRSAILLLTLAIILGSILPGCTLFSAATPTPDAAAIKQEECTLYSAAIDARYKAREEGKPGVASVKEAIVVAQDDQSAQEALALVKQQGQQQYKLDAEIVANFAALMQQAGSTRSFCLQPTTCGVEFVSDADLASLSDRIGRDWWNGFYEKYPTSGGLFSFSRLAFNTNHTQALMYVTASGGSLSASGWLVTFTKTDGKWSKPVWTRLWTS